VAADVRVSGGKVQTPVGSAPVIPLLMIGIGSYLAWFGVKYWRGSGAAVWPSFPVRSVLQGKGLPAPEPAPAVEDQLAAYEQQAAGNIGVGPAGGGTVSGTAVSTDALRYAGHCYKLGGAPGASGQGCWDCSSFVNWVIGHDLRLPIPGLQTYDGSVHGPDVAMWLTSTLARSVAAPQPGDLVLWGPNQHMGIAIGGGRMISALNPALRTAVTPIATAHVGPPVYRRLISAGSPSPTGKPQNIARLLLTRFGWDSGQMAPLIQLWTGESNWNPKARNSVSGALGIPQALGHGGSGTGGTLGNEYGAQYGLTAAQAQAANSGDELQQIRWGLGYIKARYGSPAAALAFWQAQNPHWY